MIIKALLEKKCQLSVRSFSLHTFSTSSKMKWWNSLQAAFQRNFLIISGSARWWWLPGSCGRFGGVQGVFMCISLISLPPYKLPRARYLSLSQNLVGREGRNLWGERSEASFLPAAFKVTPEKQPECEFSNSEFQNKEREREKKRKRERERERSTFLNHLRSRDQPREYRQPWLDLSTLHYGCSTLHLPWFPALNRAVFTSPAWHRRPMELPSRCLIWSIYPSRQNPAN